MNSVSPPPDYFGFFLKKHTGMTPTMIRRS